MKITLEIHPEAIEAVRGYLESIGGPTFYNAAQRGLEAVALVAVIRRLNEIALEADVVKQCSWCRRLKAATGYVDQTEKDLTPKQRANTTHGICPDCLKKQNPFEALGVALASAEPAR